MLNAGGPFLIPLPAVDADVLHDRRWWLQHSFQGQALAVPSPWSEPHAAEDANRCDRAVSARSGGSWSSGQDTLFFILPTDPAHLWAINHICALSQLVCRVLLAFRLSTCSSSTLQLKHRELSRTGFVLRVESSFSWFAVLIVAGSARWTKRARHNQRRICLKQQEDLSSMSCGFFCTSLGLGKQNVHFLPVQWFVFSASQGFFNFCLFIVNIRCHFRVFIMINKVCFCGNYCSCLNNSTNACQPLSAASALLYLFSVWTQSLVSVLFSKVTVKGQPGTCHDPRIYTRCPQHEHFLTSCLLWCILKCHANWTCLLSRLCRCLSPMLEFLAQLSLKSSLCLTCGT